MNREPRAVARKRERERLAIRRDERPPLALGDRSQTQFVAVGVSREVHAIVRERRAEGIEDRTIPQRVNQVGTLVVGVILLRRVVEIGDGEKHSPQQHIIDCVAL